MKRKILYGVATLLTLLPSAIAQADVISDWNAVIGYGDAERKHCHGVANQTFGDRACRHI